MVGLTPVGHAQRASGGEWDPGARALGMNDLAPIHTAPVRRTNLPHVAVESFPVFPAGRGASNTVA